MIIKPITMTALGLCFVCLAACSKGDGTTRRDNIFDNGTTAFIQLAHTSNADSLFLTWELKDTQIAFDSYRITTDKSSKAVTAEASATKSLLTHVPYATPVEVTVALMKGEEQVRSFSTSITIDGLDKTTAGIIIPDQGSVTAGDGMYSIPLPDGRSIFLMGDSYTGTVTNNQRSTSDHMYRNTYMLYDKGNMSALCEVNGKNTSAAVPEGVTNEGKKWYWPGHGFARGNKLYVFQTLMYQGGEGMWGFMYERTDILEYDLPAVTLSRTTTVPFRGSTDIHYGMAVLDDNDYIYVYAQVDVRNDENPISDVLVARTTLDKLYTDWEYYTGAEWSTDPTQAVKLAGLSSVPVSSQFNVFKLGGKYVLLTQNKRFNSGEIYTFTSATPYGPWGNKQLIFRTYEQKEKNLLTYNAMAHPQFTKDGMILVSYNVNTSEFSQQFSEVSAYRPRFFWVETDKILNN